MSKERFSLEFRLGNGGSDTAFVKENGNKIGYVAMVFDKESKIYDGILVFDRYIGDESYIFEVSQMIQNEFVASDEEMFVETYFGLNYGMICDETPINWDRMIKTKKEI